MIMNGEPLKNGAAERTPMTSDPGSTGAETSLPSAETQHETGQPKTDAQAVAEIMDLLSGGEDPQKPPESADPGDASNTPPDGSDVIPSDGEAGGAEGDTPPRTDAPPASLTEAAERLGIEPSALYGLEITTGDGETVTLGDLKDAYQDRAETERESAQRAVSLDERETALIAEQRIWGEVGETLTRALTPQQQEALRAHLQERDATERRRMVQAVPEWADEHAFSNFREKAVETLGGYGFKPHEIAIGDHRQMVILRDFVRMKERLAALESYQPKPTVPNQSKTQGRARGGSKRDAVLSKAKQSRHEADKIAGVAALLSGD